MTAENNTSPEGSSLLLEKKMGVEVTHPMKFDKVYCKQTITLRVTNRSNQVQFLNKWVILSKKKNSQINTFTHNIVNEAGQAMEEEIMINALTFTDNVNGQNIQAGDPMQLGSVMTLHYARELGMGESYLCRLLETFPYQKVLAAFKNIITKLIQTLYITTRSDNIACFF